MKLVGGASQLIDASEKNKLFYVNIKRKLVRTLFWSKEWTSSFITSLYRKEHSPPLLIFWSIIYVNILEINKTTYFIRRLQVYPSKEWTSSFITSLYRKEHSPPLLILGRRFFLNPRLRYLLRYFFVHGAKFVKLP